MWPVTEPVILSMTTGVPAGANSPIPQVIGAGVPGPSTKIDTAQVWPATGKTLDITFRAVGGTFTVLVYGSGVSLVAAGSGSVRLAGLPDTPHGDGQYSLNDADFTSLPGTQTPRLLIGNG